MCSTVFIISRVFFFNLVGISVFLNNVNQIRQYVRLKYPEQLTVAVAVQIVQLPITWQLLLGQILATFENPVHCSVYWKINYLQFKTLQAVKELLLFFYHNEMSSRGIS